MGLSLSIASKHIVSSQPEDLDPTDAPRLYVILKRQFLNFTSASNVRLFAVFTLNEYSKSTSPEQSGLEYRSPHPARIYLQHGRQGLEADTSRLCLKFPSLVCVHNGHAKTRVQRTEMYVG